MAAGCWMASAGHGALPAAAETVSADDPTAVDTTVDLNSIPIPIPIPIPGNPVSPDDLMAADTDLDLDSILIPGNPVTPTDPIGWFSPRLGRRIIDSGSRDVLIPDGPPIREVLKPEGPPILPAEVIQTGGLDPSDVLKPDGPPISELRGSDDPSIVDAVSAYALR